MVAVIISCSLESSFIGIAPIPLIISAKYSRDSSGQFLKATLYSTHFQTNVKNLMKNLPSQYRPLDAPYEAGGLSNEFT